MNNLLMVLGLGLAGIDPTGMVMLIPYLNDKQSKKKATLFGLSILFGVATLGGVLSGVLGQLVSTAEGFFNSLEDDIWVVLTALVILFLLYIGINRLKDKGKKQSEKAEKGSGKGFWFVIGLNIVLALTDPTFVSVVTIGGHKSELLSSFLYALLWVLISQSPLFLLVGAVLLGKHEQFISAFQSWKEKHSATLSVIVTALIFISAGVLLLDLVVYYLSGNWLLG
ncbi:hypothetical protein [Streptococcus suis]|uniref:hypothetical protein n=1 Tax=Streptococcus suis TaxID=1307 RepID=UPI001C971507|nr:hypothetical protein [Streptococcus suis]MBY5025633.1 hypothetical protein [Streptococcus suis]QZT17829.1 hypothetical protein K6974_02095 [Streptococcus suis]